MGRALLVLLILVCLILFLRALGAIFRQLQAQAWGPRTSQRREHPERDGKAAAEFAPFNPAQESREEYSRRILGVGAQAGDKEIKSAYKALLARYHPDKVSHVGGEFSELASRRTQQIREAYDFLGKKYGFK